VLVAAPLLFFSLFFTWQKLEVDFGPAGKGERLLDGWDAWGLLLFLLTGTVVTLTVLRYLTEVEMSPDIPWERLILWLGAATFAVTLVKNLRDADSTYTSYVFVLLAAVVALGAYENWAETSGKPGLIERLNKRRRVSSTA
jgi:hypothetical protein